MEKLAYLVLGWLFGVLGQSIARGSSRRLALQEILIGVEIELQDLRLKVAWWVLFSAGTGAKARLVSGRVHSTDVEGINAIVGWMDPILQSHPEGTRDLFIADLPSWEGFMAWSDQERAEWAVRTSPPLGRSGMKVLRLPFTSARLGELGLVSVKLQRLVLNSVGKLDLFNQDVQVVREIELGLLRGDEESTPNPNVQVRLERLRGQVHRGAVGLANAVTCALDEAERERRRVRWTMPWAALTSPRDQRL